MKARIFVITSILAVLILLLSGAAMAQGTRLPETSGTPDVFSPQESAFGKPIFRPTGSEVDIQSASAASIPLGQPGLSYRYVQTFGKTGVAYITDTQHLNFPYGIGTDGNSVWIGEQWGNRILKYDSTGNFQMQFGCARAPDDCPEDTEFWEIVDVAGDGGGNIWVVDASNRVVKLDSSGNRILALGEMWVEGNDNQHFVDPMSVAFDASGNVYVSDGAPFWDRGRGNHRIQIFQSDGTYLATIGQTGVCGSGNNQLCGPRHIAIYGTELYVADAGNDRVQIFDITNPVSSTYTATIGSLNNPSGVAVDANYIYVADTWNNQVQVFDRTTRAQVATIGTGWGTGNDQFKDPTDVAVDAAGNLYVADWVNTRIQQFSRSGSTWNYVRTYGVTGVPYVTDGTHYNSPTGVAIAGDGSIYLTEEYGHRLVKLNPDGTPIWTVGAAGVKGDWDSSNNRLDNPDDVALDASGRVYVADRWHGRVQVYNPDGSYYATVDNLDCPGGVGIGPNGYLYVADSCNHTVKIYDTSLALTATLGTPGGAGTDNAHFDWPEDVAVDSDGTIYVSDQGNHRVQVFDANRQYVRTMGETDVSGSDFAHFNNLNGLFVDANHRLYVADDWNNRVQVFDKDGNYLTTIGGNWGNQIGQFRGAHGVAVDSAGNVYVADNDNHRIQKYTPGVPGWQQMNINGFGERDNRISTLTPFGGNLYAGTFNHGGNGAQLWRTTDGLTWTSVITNGFGNSANVGIDHLLEFNNQLYAGTWANEVNGGEIWRSSDGLNWTRVVNQGFGDPTNGEVMRFGVFDGQLYAGTWSWTTTHGTEIWRSATGNANDWTRVVSNGFGDADNIAILTMKEFNGALYVSTYSGKNSPNGADIWRTTDGIIWTPVITDGFNYTGTYTINALESFGGYLYAGTGRYDLNTQSYPGGQIWRCSAASGCDEPSDWGVVVSDGFGNADNAGMQLIVLDNQLYAVVYNPQTGMEVWRTSNGTQWTQVGFAGLGDSNNHGAYWNNSITVYNNRLFIGTTNWANGGEVWMMLRHIFLPLVLRTSP